MAEKKQTKNAEPKTTTPRVPRAVSPEVAKAREECQNIMADAADRCKITMQKARKEAQARKVLDSLTEEQKEALRESFLKQ